MLHKKCFKVFDVFSKNANFYFFPCGSYISANTKQQYFSIVNLVFIFRCSSTTTNPVCERRVNLLVYSLSLHRHSYIGFILVFASSIHNKQPSVYSYVINYISLLHRAHFIDSYLCSYFNKMSSIKWDLCWKSFNIGWHRYPFVCLFLNSRFNYFWWESEDHSIIFCESDRTWFFYPTFFCSKCRQGSRRKR